MEFLISQLFGIAASVCALTSMQVKSIKKVLGWNLSCNVMSGLSYILVGGFSGKGWVVTEAMLPDGSKGYVNINRLPGCEENVWRMKFKGCDCSLDYVITDVANGRKFNVSGYTLYSEGLPIALDGALTSCMLIAEAKK